MTRTGISAAKAKWILVAYWVLMYIGTHIPEIDRIKRQLPFRFGGMSFVIHTIMYGTWAVLILWVLSVSLSRPTGLREYLLIWGVGLAYAIFDECTQLLVGRTGKPIDVTVDMAAVTAVLAIAALRRHMADKAAPSTTRGRP